MYCYHHPRVLSQTNGMLTSVSDCCIFLFHSVGSTCNLIIFSSLMHLVTVDVPCPSEDLMLGSTGLEKRKESFVGPSDALQEHTHDWSVLCHLSLLRLCFLTVVALCLLYSHLLFQHCSCLSLFENFYRWRHFNLVFWERLWFR